MMGSNNSSQNDDDYDDDINDDVDNVQDDDDDDDEESLRTENANMKRALAKANREAKKYRLKAKRLMSNDGGNTKDPKNAEVEKERIREETTEAEELRWKKRVVRQAAKASLLEAGLLGDAAKLAKLVDEDEIEVDENGEITDGLDEQIEDIRSDYPDLFEDRTERGKKSRNLRSIDGGNRDRVPKRQLTSAEKIQAQALKHGRR